MDDKVADFVHFLETTPGACWMSSYKAMLPIIAGLGSGFIGGATCGSF